MKKKALIVISSATTLPLTSPERHPGISTGFFLVELADVLREFERDYEFVFATPDGHVPQLDVNGMALSFHGIEKLGVEFFKSMLAQGSKKFNPAAYRAANPSLVARRDQELELAYRHLGHLPVSQVLPKTDLEAAAMRDTFAMAFAELPKREYLSIQQLIAFDDDPDNPFSLGDFDFMHAPGGHAPMVDFHDNPLMGELLNRLYQHKVLISLICHAPVAMTSAKYRIDAKGKPVIQQNNPFRGAAVTTVPKFGELIALMSSYPKVPGKKTRLPYYVDQAIEQAGYQVHTSLNPTAARLEWAENVKLLTGNGPQAIDQQAARLRTLLNDMEQG